MKDYTHIAIVLDRSGSMSSLAHEIIGGYNAFVDDQKKVPGKGTLTLVQFDNEIDHHVSYAQGHVHTNGMENFWSLLKRTIKGTYINVEPFHLFRYLDEQAFRFNLRKLDDQGRFLVGLRGIVGKTLRYAALIADNGEAPDGLPA